MIHTTSGDLLRDRVLRNRGRQPASAKHGPREAGGLHLEIFHPRGVRAIRFSPSGALLTTGCVDGFVRLFDIESGALVMELDTGECGVYSFGFSPSEPLLAVANGNMVSLFDTVSGELFKQVPHGDLVRSVKFAPSGSGLGTGCDDCFARVFDVQTLELKLELRHDSGINSLDFSPDSTLIATASEDRRVRLFDAFTGALQKEHDPEDSRTWATCFDPSGRHTITCCREGKVRMRDVTTCTIVEEFAHPANVWAANFSFNGKLLATACEDGRARIFDVSTGSLMQQLDQGDCTEGARCVAFSPKDTLLAAGSFDSSARVFFVDDPYRNASRRRSGIRWQYLGKQSCGGRSLSVLRVPELRGPRTGAMIEANTIFEVSEERKGADGILYLRLASGHGWVQAGEPGTANLCRRHVSTRDAIVHALIYLVPLTVGILLLIALVHWK